MSESATDKRGRAWLRRYGHAGVYVAAIGIGLFTGAKGVFGSGRAHAAGSSTELMRVGYALQARSADAAPAARQALCADVERVRADLKPEERPVLDLVVAVRGLCTGAPDLVRAERICGELGWTRCDRAALERLSLGEDR